MLHTIAGLLLDRRHIAIYLGPQMRLRLTFVTCIALLLSASGAFSAAPQADKAGPYQIAQRPMPKDEDLEVLLPRTVGTFARKPLPAGTKPPVDEDLNVDYVSGTDTVNVGFSIPGKVADAHEAIRVARQDGIDTLRKTAKGKQQLQQAQESIGPPTSFYKLPDFIAWSRGGYFYYAKANSPAALDAFMRAFPF